MSSLDTISGKVLKEIIKFYCNVKLKGVSTKEVDLVDKVAKHLVVRQHSLPADPSSVGGGEGTYN